MLNDSSAQTSMGSMFISPTTIVNNYAVAGGEGGGEGSDDSTFLSSFTAFTVPYSLASK